MSFPTNIFRTDILSKQPSFIKFLPVIIILFLVSLLISGSSISFKFIGVMSIAAFLSLGILRPEMFLLSLFAIRPLLDQFIGVSFLHLGPVRLNIQTILGGGIVFVALYYFLDRKFPLFKFKFALPAILFLLLNVISMFLSDNILAGMHDWFRICSWIIMLFWIIAVFNTKKKIDYLIKACVLAAVISVFIITFQWMIGGATFFYRPEVGARFGWFGGPNAAGFILLGACPFVLFRTFQTKRPKQILYIGLVVAIAVAVFFTYFRTNWIIFLIQIMVLMVLKRKEIKRPLFIFILIMIVIGIWGTTRRYSVEIETRLEDIYYFKDLSIIRRTGSGRFGIWGDNLYAFVQAPILTKLLGRGMKASVAIEGRHEAHSDFINILSNNGLIGLFIYLWFLFTLFKIGKLLFKTATLPYYKNIACTFWIVFISWLVRGILTGTVFGPGGMWYVVAAIGITNVAVMIQNNKQTYLYTLKHTELQ